MSKKKAKKPKWEMFVDGKFNHTRPPKGYNYHYGGCIKDYKNESPAPDSIKIMDEVKNFKN